MKIHKICNKFVRERFIQYILPKKNAARAFDILKIVMM